MLHIYIVIFFFVFTLYNVIVEQNLIKKVIFSSIMQSAVIIYYIMSVWNISGSTPFYNGTSNSNYVDPVPQVLMLTAIVVGFATTALSLALVIRIKRKYKTIMMNEIEERQRKQQQI